MRRRIIAVIALIPALLFGCAGPTTNTTAQTGNTSSQEVAQEDSTQNSVTLTALQRSDGWNYGGSGSDGFYYVSSSVRDDGSANLMYSNWFLKQKGWEYEREWRIVEESTSNYFDYNPGELVGIILGTNLDSHIGDAIKHCVPSSVRILKAWPGQRTFEILITDGEYQKLGDGSPIPKITDIDSFLSSNV